MPKMLYPHNSGFAPSIFLKMYNNEKGQQVHKNYINGFSEKILVCPKWGVMGPKMKYSYNSGFALSFFLKFCSTKKMQ